MASNCFVPFEKDYSSPYTLLHTFRNKEDRIVCRGKTLTAQHFADRDPEVQESMCAIQDVLKHNKRHMLQFSEIYVQMPVCTQQLSLSSSSGKEQTWSNH